MVTKSWNASRASCMKYSVEFEWNDDSWFRAETTTFSILDGFEYKLDADEIREEKFLAGQSYSADDGMMIHITSHPKPGDIDMLFKVTLTHKKEHWSGAGILDKDGVTNIQLRGCPSDFSRIHLELLTFPDFQTSAKILDSDLCGFRIKLNQDDDFNGDGNDNEEGTVMLPTSKCLLMSKSEVFRKMLNSEMKEARSNELDLSDMPRALVKEMICFINTGTSKFENLALYGENAEEDAKLTREAIETAKLADCYQIAMLKQICSRFLRPRVSIEYAIEFLELSNNYSIFDLRDRVLKHINANAKAAVASDLIKDIISKDPIVRDQIFNALAGVYPEPT